MPTIRTVLDEIERFLAAEWPSSNLRDGYSVVSLYPRVSHTLWAPADRYLGQIPATLALFERLLRESTRLWVLTLNLDVRRHLRGPHRFDCRTEWTQPDWYDAHEHAICGIEAAPAVVDARAIMRRRPTRSPTC